MPHKEQAAKINRVERSTTRSPTSPTKIEEQSKFSSTAETKQTFQQTRIDPQALRPHALLHLQRTIGNHAVQRLLATRTIQTKLTIGAAHDLYEEEADRVAGPVIGLQSPETGRGIATRVRIQINRT